CVDRRFGYHPRPVNKEHDDIGGGMCGEGEISRYAEGGSATSAAGPEQIGIVPVVTVEPPPVRRHQLDRAEPVGEDPVFAADHADAAAEGQTGDADGRTG